MKAMLCTVLGGMLLLAAPRAGAQEEQPSEPAPQAGAKAPGKNDQAPKVKVERGKGGRKVFRITTSWVIEGRIQKPNAFYVLQRSQINYDWAKMKQNFLPKITDSVSETPF